jgi:hypothetical protein
MIQQTVRKGIQGVCDVCDKSIEVFRTHGNILMCQGCIELESETLKNVAQEHEMNRLLADSKAIDESMTLKQDIFNGKTIAAVELKAAIMADDSILPKDKEYTYALACKERLLHFQKRVFDKKQEVIEEENTARMWQAQAQSAAAEVRDERREQFKNLRSDYQPKVVKEIKPKTIKVPKKSSKLVTEEARQAAAKYSVDSSIVAMMATAKNISPTLAAEMYARQLGLIK